MVAVEVKKLADEIKSLTGEVDSGIQDVEQGTDHLNSSIATSQQALEDSLDNVDETYQKFDEIIRSAEGADTVHSEIVKVIGSSQDDLQLLYRFFDKMKEQYQEVMGHINQAGRLGTTKSTMYEDIDNMLSQIPPILHTERALTLNKDGRYISAVFLSLLQGLCLQFIEFCHTFIYRCTFQKAPHYQTGVAPLL